MAKNIVICSDGTGNSAIKGRGTNVFKLYEAVDLHSSQPQQVAIYDDGVGTEKNKIWKLFTGMTGWGLSRNVKELYANLARVYDPGDNIYLFGFSRGAFTVRTLAAFICSCGLPDPDPSKCKNDAEFLKQVKRAYTKYRSDYMSLLGILFMPFRMMLGLDKIDKKKFRENVSIRFIGVWDTVDAVGFPIPFIAGAMNLIYKFKFKNPKLDDKVDRACHALSIDDERFTFSPTLWDEDVKRRERIDQVWFSGVHSNVGGGYPKQGMSLVSLSWMMAQAEDADLQFLGHDQDHYRNHRNVNDKLYNSRAGLAVYYRYRPRDIKKISEKNNITIPKIHISAVARIAQGTEGYSPGNLPADLKIVETPPPKDNTGNTPPSQKDYGDIEDLIREKHNGDESLLKRYGSLKWLRVAGYYGFLIFSVWALSGYVRMEVDGPFPASFWEKLKVIFAALAHLPTFDGMGKLWKSLWENYGILAGLIVSVAVGLGARWGMHKVFSEFWFSIQSGLKKLLKNLGNP